MIREAYPDDEVLQRMMAAKRSGQRRIPHDLIRAGIRIELGDCEIIEGLFYILKRLYVPDVPELRSRVIKEIYDLAVGGHAGRSSTYERVSTYYFWTRMTSTVA